MAKIINMNGTKTIPITVNQLSSCGLISLTSASQQRILHTNLLFCEYFNVF